MRNNFITFLIINIYTYAKNHIILSISILFLFFAPPLYAKYNYSLETTNIIRDTQLLLSLNGVYTGPLDGICNAQTIKAINESRLAKTRFDKSREIDCNIESLEAIKPDLRSVLMADASTSSPDYAGYIPAPSTPSQTAWALLGLMAAGFVEDKAVTLEVRYLTRTQAEDGFWKEERFTATGFRRVFFCAIPATRNIPLWPMARFRNLKKGDRHPGWWECDRLPGHRRHRP